MELRVAPAGDWLVLLDGDQPLRTPAGTAVVSHHRALLEEVAADVARWGPDPRAKTTTFSLQASYLDFGIPVQRRVLEENTAAIWPDDLFVRRPSDPAQAAASLALWGPVDLDRAAFREALGRLTLRQLMAVMTAGHVLRSAVLGLRVVTTGADLVPLTRGACGRFSAAARHVPTDRDEDFCADSCCAADAVDPAPFRARCALHPLLDKMRRWSAFPEEVEKGA
jgi:hypothetical protein